MNRSGSRPAFLTKMRYRVGFHFRSRFTVLGSHYTSGWHPKLMCGGLVIRYSLPRYRRFLRALRRWVNSSIDALRTPISQSSVLVVTGDAPLAKTDEIVNRLRYLFAHLGKDLTVQTTHAASPIDYLRSLAVVAVEGTAVSPVARRSLKWVADLDYETNPRDGWELVDLGVAISGGIPRSTVSTARRTFLEHAIALKADRARPAYLFGTGPSLRFAEKRTFADGIVVVCNTIVRDPSLWHHLNPAFLAAGDAIYHFGHNAHAREFRTDALRRLEESNGRTLFVYPAPYDVIVRPEFRAVESLLIPIPWGAHTDVTVDLTEHFSLPEVGNILNVLLLPLGCTLSSDIRLWGFDGRGPTDSGFWANSSAHTYPELMQSIRSAHPSFFCNSIPPGNEFRYVNEVHGDWLDDRLSDAERRGFRFRMLHHSWTATLQKRFPN